MKSNDIFEFGAPPSCTSGRFGMHYDKNGVASLDLRQDQDILDYGIDWFILIKNPSGMGVTLIEQAKMEKPLTQTEYRVRDWIIGHMELNNLAYINQAEMARELNIGAAHANKAVKRLVELGILLVYNTVGKSKVYRANPAFCYQGSTRFAAIERNKVVAAKLRSRTKRIPRQKKHDPENSQDNRSTDNG